MTQLKTPDANASFDLVAMALELQKEATYQREGQTARTLLRAPDLRIVLVALKAGRKLAEHQAQVTASVHALSGHLRLKLTDRSAELPAGQMIVLGPGQAHDVYAESDSIFVLTLGWNAPQ